MNLVLDLMHVDAFVICCEFGKSTIIFVADMSSYVHIDNRKEDNLILDKGPTQGLNDNTFTMEAEYKINFSKQWNKFVPSKFAL